LGGTPGRLLRLRRQRPIIARMFGRVDLGGLCSSEGRAPCHDPRRRTGWWPREQMDTMAGYGHHAQDWRPPSVRFPRGVPMTDAELRTIEFLFPSDATRPADLPDWLLALLEGDRPEELSHELITAASLMYIRRQRPGINFDDARALIAAYAADPAGLEELAGR